MKRAVGKPRRRGTGGRWKPDTEYKGATMITFFASESSGCRPQGNSSSVCSNPSSWQGEGWLGEDAPTARGVWSRPSLTGISLEENHDDT